MRRALRCCGNPGRGGYALASCGEELLWEARRTVADFFAWEDATQVVFTAGCTAAINAVVHGLPSGVAVVSDMEHNAVLRPLYADGWRIIQAETGETDEQAVEGFERALRGGATLVVCTHASNVTGRVLPVREIAQAAHRRGALFCLDAAQTAGTLPVPCEVADFVCLPGHKGLHGPMGVGVLLVRRGIQLRPFMQGGTGVLSRKAEMPGGYPERLEAGTPNLTGIAGLAAGIGWVKAVGAARIHAREMAALRQVYAALKGDGRFTWYGQPTSHNAAVLSFSVEGIPAAQVAERLAQEGIAVRAGLHCAPAAHRKLASPEDGAVRLAPGVSADAASAEKIIKILHQLG